jgi:unsaturated rhamnogalacturonyl hydrolase
MSAAPPDPHALRAAADILRAYPYSCWHYGDSTGFEGLLAASEVLGDPGYAAFAHGAVVGWAAAERPLRELDNTAPGYAICRLYRQTGDERLLDAGRRLAAYLVTRRRYRGAFLAFERAPLKEPYDGSALTPEEVDLLADPGAGVFVDPLHFDPPFLVALGSIVGDPALVEEGVAQALALCDVLQDDGSGLFAHFALERTGERYGLAWSRGQGWALLGLVEVLEELPVDHPGRDRLLHALGALVAGLERTQDPSGHWRALCQDPSTYLESSVALFVAAGVPRAIDAGLLDEGLRGMARRAWEAGTAALAPDGTLAGVSAAVWCSTALGHYGGVPVGFQVPWGQGPLLPAAEQWGLRAV